MVNLGVIIFGSVFIKKKATKPNFFKKNQNWFKPTGFGSICFFIKTSLARFGLIFLFWIRFGSVFSVSSL
jgi:hypothetical protein